MSGGGISPQPDKVANRVSARLPPVARRELAIPEIAHGLVKTMCKNHSSTGPKSTANTDGPDENLASL
jgi:hypothetical protein